MYIINHHYYFCYFFSIYRHSVLFIVFFFFFKQKTAYEMLRSLVGSEMCIRDRAPMEEPPLPDQPNERLLAQLEHLPGVTLPSEEEHESWSLGAGSDARLYFGVLGVLVSLTVADGVIPVVLFDKFKTQYALYLNQATATVYGIAALAIVGWQSRSSPQEPSPKNIRPMTPWYFLVAIGCFNGTANFFQAIAQPHTPGLTQTLLSLLNIPLVVLISWGVTCTRPALIVIIAAATILAGTAASGLRSVPDLPGAPPDGGGPQARSLSIFMYAFGQVFMSGEKVFEEVIFTRYTRQNVMVMFLVTMWTQWMLGWVLYPMQCIPEFGGFSLSELPSVVPVSYTHLRAHETPEHLVCRLLLEKKKKNNKQYRVSIYRKEITKVVMMIDNIHTV
eukprot:TRINITY_DN50172_c0_g1_i2.p1 TRINITY_DN50172_c0_g1~~TRINITY_DN50172_c0_g1_i2.p1  ORF type:complete len:389 (+),score=81.02 TRINITY_DN50172_c0_g1_i2:39-1205(+)